MKGQHKVGVKEGRGMFKCPRGISLDRDVTLALEGHLSTKMLDFGPLAIRVKVERRRFLFKRGFFRGSVRVKERTPRHACKRRPLGRLKWRWR